MEMGDNNVRLIETKQFLAEMAGINKIAAEQVELGYSASRIGLDGRALIGPKSLGLQLLIRLKDSEGALLDEIAFWSKLVARLAPDPSNFDLVSNPPSSGKRSYYLAETMAKIIAADLGLPYASTFTNLSERKNRASMQAKLRELKKYRYDGEPGKRILMVDDARCTGLTALACVEAAAGCAMYFIFLYGS